MNYREEWLAITARISSLAAAASKNLNSASWRYFRDQCLGILTIIEEFKNTFGLVLPPASIAAIDRILVHRVGLSERDQILEMMIQRTLQALAELQAFESELTYLLTDRQQKIRSITERAFQHLRRLIVADSEMQRKWNSAFEQKEVACERLGGAHLLWHGIFAFKAQGPSAQTDLILGEPVSEGVAGYAEGLVLTEWKVAVNEKEAITKLSQARSQAEQYAGGLLAGIELRSHRYLVIVTDKGIELPPDITMGTITYRHVNIPVRPAVASIAARNASKIRRVDDLRP
jgi:hypothetical protein